MRVGEGTVAPYSCQVGGHGVSTYDIVSAHFDPFNQNIVFATTVRGEVLVFETHGT